MSTDTDINELVTIDEQIEILGRARQLIWEPESWAVGAWKCPIYQRDPDGGVLLDADGKGIPVTNENGAVAHQYCAEGAINQATYDVLGEDRAKALGAVRFNNETGELVFAGNEEEFGYDATMLLGLDAMAEREGYESLMSMNDSEDEDEDYEIHKRRIHEKIVSIFSEKLADLNRRKERAA